MSSDVADAAHTLTVGREMLMRMIPGGLNAPTSRKNLTVLHPEVSSGFLEPSVASLNLMPKFGDIEGNLCLAEKAIRSAKASDPSLRWVVLPELFTSGYSDLASVHRYAEDANRGMSAWRLSSLAHELGVYIAYGFPEGLECGGIATSANLVGPDTPGALMTYRKIHLVETTPEHVVFTPGTDIPVTEAGGMRVAMLVCWDLSHPATVARAASKGVDLILAPAAWRDPWTKQYDLTCAARALDNGIYVASANQIGHYPEADFSARGAVYAPDGVRISQGVGNTNIAPLDTAYPAKWQEQFGDALGTERGDYPAPGHTSSGIA